MKKLGNIKINPEKMLNNDELIALRGGYGYVVCRLDGEPCGPWYEGWVGDCSMSEEACNTMCGTQNWNSAICAG